MTNVTNVTKGRLFMRLALIADIHGNLTALEAALTDLKNAGDIDMLWCLGDLAAFGPRPSECVARVRGLMDEYGKDKVQVIGGNTDRYLVTGARPSDEAIRFKAAEGDDDLPEAEKAALLLKRVRANTERDQTLNWNLAQLSTEDYAFLARIIGREAGKTIEGYGRVLGVHAIPGDDDAQSLRRDAPLEEARDALLDREGKLVLVGHTHEQYDRDLGRWRLINPGSVGMAFKNPGVAEYALLSFENSTLSVDFRQVPYDLEAAIQDVQATGHPAPEWIIDRLSRAR